MLTHRVGAASRAGGANMAAYLAAGTQQPAQEHNAAIYYAGQDKGLAEPANATLSPELSPAMAQRLGIDRGGSLSVGAVANLMVGRPPRATASRASVIALRGGLARGGVRHLRGQRTGRARPRSCACSGPRNWRTRWPGGGLTGRPSSCRRRKDPTG